MKRPKCTCKETVTKNTLRKTFDPKCQLHSGVRRHYYRPDDEEEEDELKHSPFANYKRFGSK